MFECADLVIPALDCDKSVTCMLRHDERLPAGGMAFLQAALLYTTPDGHRRVRVHTLALPVASSLGSVFRGADLDTTLQVSIILCFVYFITWCFVGAGFILSCFCWDEVACATLLNERTVYPVEVPVL
jgi:Sec23/Sec24 beta-sandwich domain